MARRRSHSRRRTHRRRRHNPALIRGLPLPNFTEVGVGIAGGIGAKMLGRLVFPRATGWMSPATTFGAAVALGVVLQMLKMRQFAKAAVTGGTIIAGIDALKLTPLGPQLAGAYVAPGDEVPVLSGGMGMFPPGFQDPSLAAGEESGFDMTDESGGFDY